MKKGNILILGLLAVVLAFVSAGCSIPPFERIVITLNPVDGTEAKEEEPKETGEDPKEEGEDPEEEGEEPEEKGEEPEEEGEDPKEEEKPEEPEEGDGSDPAHPKTKVIPAQNISTDWSAINSEVLAAQQYVILDLSDCTVNGNAISGELSSSPSGNHMNIIKDNPYITGIILPSDLQTIGQSAFYGCQYLTSVTISEGVISIGNGAFEGCTSLTDIIVDEAHPNLSSQDGVLFNKDKTRLAYYPWGKKGAYTIPDGVNYISITAFRCNPNLTAITIPEGVTSIENQAFESCTSLTDVIIPASVTSIGGYAFAYCTNLTAITIPDSVTAIHTSAFEGCTSLANVTIPASVTSIGSWAFQGCSSLTSVTFAGTIGSSDFNTTSFFRSDLRDKYLADGGGIGTYTRTGGAGTVINPYVWTKQ